MVSTTSAIQSAAAMIVLSFLILPLVKVTFAIKLDHSLRDLEWIIGRWESVTPYNGSVHWPTIPTMQYYEVVDFWPAEVSNNAIGFKYINYSAVAISHNSNDHFHNEYGYITMLPHKPRPVKMFAIGNNGFATVEHGEAGYGFMTLESTRIDTIIVARELPTEAIKRIFKMLTHDFNTGDMTMHMQLLMRTITHPDPKDTTRYYREHAKITYKKIKTMKDLENGKLQGNFFV